MSREQDEMEDSLYEDHLLPPGRSSGLVNSPTTDTLDSVALETSPTDEQDLGGEVSLTGDQEDQDDSIIIMGSAGGGDRNTYILAPADVSIDLNSSIMPSASETQMLFSDPLQGKEGPHQPSGGHQAPQTISSYFASQPSQDDFFDCIKESTIGGKCDGDIGTAAQSAFDKISSIEPQDASPQDENIQAPFPETKEDEEETTNVEADVTHISHREHKISTSELEAVSFEGTETAGEDTNNLTDLTEEEKDEFESFTAAEGSDVIQHTGLVERSDSLPHDNIVASSSSSGQQQKLQQQMSQPHGMVEETGSMLQSLSIQGPTVGTTPTNMSPLHTSSNTAQPAAASAEHPQFERQTSAPTSPFHTAVDSGPQSGFPSFGDVGVGDDIFTASLTVSDADRRFDAWIPSDATRHILITMATNPPGSFSPAVEQLSTPGVLSMEPQGDPVRDLVYRYMGEQEAIRRHVLTADSVSQDCDGLQKLVSTGSLRAAMDLTGRMLVNGGQGPSNTGQATQHSPQMLQLWFCRLALMVKLRLYEMAESEMRAFQTLDTPDLYFEYYPHRFPGRRGSMVCFAMRILHADLPNLNGRSQETLDRLYYILAVVRKILSNLNNDLCEDGSAAHISADSRKLSKELWLERERQVLYKIASTLLSVRDYQASLAMYTSLLEKDIARRAELLTGISRIHLQMGNVTKANEIHAEVEKLLTKGDNRSACRNAMNKGLSAMCINNFSEAYNHFKMAVQLEPTNTCAVNNMAVCSLYLGRLKDALNTLEAIVHSDPARNLHEGILFNLCTLYELESSRALHKKQAVLDLVSKHKGDGFPIACLKMA